MLILDLFLTFFKIGAFTFGGGYAMIPLIEREIINNKGWIEEEELLECVQLVIVETIRRMNQEIPRPSLKGVTPGDVREGIAGERMEINRKYVEQELGKKEVIKPWNKKDWAIVKEQLFKGATGNHELLTKFCFFLKRPLRKLVKLEREVLGN